jgi:GNAT superfamily N-acetyltransferase
VTSAHQFRIEPATEADVPLVLGLIRALAEYERLAHEVVATEASLRQALFGPRAVAEAIIAHAGAEAVGLAVWFHNYSTFLGRPGLYLEDLFVMPQWRGRGLGRHMLAYLARVAVARGCGRLEWSVLNWNDPAIRFYQALGARAMDEWTVYRLAGDALERLASEGAGAGPPTP